VTSQRLALAGLKTYLFVTSLTLFASVALPQTSGVPERFTALAVNMGTPGRTWAGRVEIVVSRCDRTTTLVAFPRTLDCRAGPTAEMPVALA
jgi:hypothetical protein